MASRRAGFYGKLPSLGDFCVRNLPPEFVTPWDNWLRTALGLARRSISDDLAWRQTFLTSPIWRFILAAGVCGPHGWTGVIGPGSDKVGRFFPLTIVIPLEHDADISRLSTSWEDGYRAAEDMLLATLDNRYDADTLAAAAEGMFMGLRPPRRANMASNRFAGERPMVRVPLDVRGDPRVAASVSTAAAHSGLVPYSMWWHVGWSQAEPSAVSCVGLPDPTGFKSFISGDWTDAGWRPDEVDV